MPLIGVSSSHGMSARLKPVVAGGTLSSDETYYYRAFTTNDTFSVSGGNISVDYMIQSVMAMMTITFQMM